MDSLRGKLLISSAGLYDDNFRHTVVLIGAHDDEGALGVVLNRPTDVTVGDAIEPLAAVTGADALLFHGGPVRPQEPVLLAEFDDPSHADLEITPRLGFLTGEVEAEVQPHVLRARVYAGHAGWGAGQLEEELAADAWIVADLEIDDVFTDDPASLWKRILLRQGPEYRTVAMMPYDPRVN